MGNGSYSGSAEVTDMGHNWLSGSSKRKSILYRVRCRLCSESVESHKGAYGYVHEYICGRLLAVERFKPQRVDMGSQTLANWSAITNIPVQSGMMQENCLSYNCLSTRFLFALAEEVWKFSVLY
jgi:hypothetical protein